MKVWTPIFNFIAAILILLLGAAYLNMCEVLEDDFDQARFNYAVQQATEAMFRRTLQAEDIDLDYQDMSYIQIDSSNALEVFDRVMCANYNMAPSEENFATINDSIAACVIAGYDGYYLLQYAEDDLIQNGTSLDGYSPRFSAKIPYCLYNGNNVYSMDTYKLTNVSMPILYSQKGNSPGINVTGGTYPAGIDASSIAEDINQQVRSAILNELENSRNASIGSLSEFNFLFPIETTVTGVNPFEPPAIFIVMDGAEYASTEALSSMTAAGYKVVQKLQYIAFTDTRTGRSYYCLEGQMQDNEKDAASGGVPMGGTYGRFRIENYFGSAKQAAEAVSDVTGEHYAPYYDLLIRKASKDQRE